MGKILNSLINCRGRKSTPLNLVKDFYFFFMLLWPITSLSMLLSGPENFFIGSYATFVYLSIITFYWTPIFQDKLDIKNRSLNILMYLFQWLPFFGNLGLIALKLSKRGKSSNSSDKLRKVELKRKKKSDKTDSKDSETSSDDKLEDRKNKGKLKNGKSSKTGEEETDSEDSEEDEKTETANQEEPEEEESLEQKSTDDNYVDRINSFHNQGGYRYRLLERIGRRLLNQDSSPEEVYSLISEFSESDRFREMSLDELEQIATEANEMNLSSIEDKLV